ncbi:MAG: DUF222 domain-containing protein, partial [Geodermatophilaceae bacterium]|nr:DUF222 domain-containing protein [Geodermatophilaceae bacterium]
MTTAAVLPDPGRGTASQPACGPVGVARAAVGEALGAGVWSLSEPELVADLRETLALRAQVDALLLRQVAEVDSRGIAARRGCPSTRAWLRSAHRIGPGEASVLVKTATALRDELPGVAAALTEGDLSLAQAQVCVTAIADLPAETPVACRPQAEATMIEAAAAFDPVLLTRIGRRLAEIIDPDGVQARDEQPIRDKERDAHRDRTLTLSPDKGGAGGWLRARLDAVGFATLAAYLDAATAPGLSPDLIIGDQEAQEGETAGTEADPAEASAAAAGDTRTIGQRRHDALIEAIRWVLSIGELPSAGGVKPRIVVTIPYGCLWDRTGAGRLADGTLISPTLTRLLADDAEIVPVWLGPSGEPLDVGRSHRLYSGRIRTPLDIRDRGCAWPGCSRPPSWCQSHHIRAWIDGGATDLANGVL